MGRGRRRLRWNWDRIRLEIVESTYFSYDLAPQLSRNIHFATDLAPATYETTLELCYVEVVKQPYFQEDTIQLNG
jgi:hypothetical protein